MGIFDIFKPKPPADNQEQAVILTFNYGLPDLSALHELEDLLERTLEEQNAGECDGHEIATDLSDGFIYLYGPNAENLFKAVKPILESTAFMNGATATLRFGPPEEGIKEIDIKIESVH
jgi:hypothetical protein